MKIRVSLLVVPVLLASTISLPSFAQGLPKTVMGKYVHQPGDNQYQPGAQVFRHGAEPGSYLDVTGCEDHRPEIQQKQQQVMLQVAPSYRLAPPPPPGPDVSVDPIAAEEPVPPAGFPPMPLALDLPVQMGVSVSTGKGAWRNGGGGSGGGGGGSGGAPTSAGMHQHYNHFQPGAWSAPKDNRNFASGGGEGGGGGDSGGGGEAPNYGADAGGGFGGGPAQPTSYKVTSPAVPVATDKGPPSNYYKVRTPAPIMRTDRFDTSTNGTTGKGAASAATAVGGRAPANSKAPGLDDSQDAGAGAAPTPTAAGLFQSQPEDLTLPDDEYVSRNFKDGRGGRYMKQQMKRGKALGRQMLRQTGMPIGF